MVLTFGEILLRLSPAFGGKWIKDSTIPTFIGGAELNVATALANWGIDVGFSSALPDNSLSSEIKKHLHEININTDKLIFNGNRIGIYMLPQGADLKNASVIYDRANSSFSELKKEDIDWDWLFSDVNWLHLSAISPALSQDVADLCLATVKEASSRKIKISFDLNHREKLWKYGKLPIEIIPQIASYCDILMGNIWAANSLLGIVLNTNAGTSSANYDDYLAFAKTSSEQVCQQFPNVKTVAYTYRFTTENNQLDYFATLYTNKGLSVSRKFHIQEVVDRVGSGDCFMAGLIYGLIKENNDKNIIDFAAAAAVGKLQEYGDATGQSVDDVLNQLNKV